METNNNTQAINTNLDDLNFSTSEINREFIIKVSGVNFDGPKIHKAVGVRGLVSLIGVELTNTLLDKAFRSMDDKSVHKLRRGLKVSFYAH